MKSILILILLVAFVFPSLRLKAADTNAAVTDAEAKYTATLENRVGDILKVLNLNDPDKSARVHDILIAQYRALNAWHNENDAKLKASRGDTNAIAEIHYSLKLLHDGFLTKLAESLTPEQIEAVKDKMTYGKVQFTFAGYVAQYPDLSETNKQDILTMLKAAREEAMDGGSAGEKTAVFQRYKGRINNYLSKQGLHPAKPNPVGTATNSVPDKQ